MKRFFLYSLLCLALIPNVTNGQASLFTEIGYTDLVNRLGGSTPTGNGIRVSMVEVSISGNYRPDTSSSQFTGKTFFDFGGGSGTSGHAQTVAVNYFGLTGSIAPGITQINTYRVDGSVSSIDWFGAAYLNFDTVNAPLSDPSSRIMNHSWIGTGSANDPDNLQVSRRVDFAIRRDNQLYVVGVNNANDSIPALLGHSYNSMAVGLTNRGSSIGPTTGDTSGRSKPDIVVPHSFTSFATPVVGAAGALLMQTADAKSGGESFDASRVETIKAILMTGATKQEFVGWSAPYDWKRINNGSFIEPLDRRYGAGQLNINNSHRIMEQSEKNGTDQVVDGLIGWDFDSFSAQGQTRRYYFDTPNGVDLITASATVTWLRRIVQAGGNFDTSNPTLSRIELRLFEVDSNFNLTNLIDASLSPIDNVQHIWNTSSLQGGKRYAWEVTLAQLPNGQTEENFAIAWMVVPVPEPALLSSTGLVFFGYMWLRKRKQSRIVPSAN